MKFTENNAKKFGGLNYFYYLCIGNTEVTKTLLIEKENNMKHTEKDYQNLEKKYDFLMEILTDNQLEEFEVFCNENNL